MNGVMYLLSWALVCLVVDVMLVSSVKLQIPPTSERCSKPVTSKPSSARFFMAARPAGPVVGQSVRVNQVQGRLMAYRRR